MTARDAIRGTQPIIDPVALIRSRGRAPERTSATQASPWWRSMEWSITAVMVMLVFFPVLNSIMTAGWLADLPNLRLVGFIALAVAAILAASPLHWSLGALISLPVGAVVVFWQVLTTETVSNQAFFFDRFEALWFRLEDWFTQAFNSGITTDNLPFVLFLVVVSWILVFFGSFAVFRGRHPWLLIISMGIMLSINVSYLDGKQWDWNFAFFAAGAGLLVMRTNLLRRMVSWRAEGTRFPDFISISFLVATVFAIATLILFTRVLPRPDESAALNNFWDDVTSPFGDLSDDFARLFSGIDSARGAPIHSFGDNFVLQGDINPGDQIVLRVDSPEPGLLRGATYDRYTARGWQQSQTVTSPLAEDSPVQPSNSSAEPYRDRRSVTTRLSVESSPRALFSFGVPTQVNRPVDLQQTAPAVARLELGDPMSVAAQDLQIVIATIAERSEERPLTEAETLGLIPSEYEVIGLTNSLEDGRIETITVQSSPQNADVVAIRSPDKVRAGFTYQVQGSVSNAEAGALQLAGQDYPLWVREGFLSLPSSLDADDRARLQGFAVSILQEFGAATPYDAAAAIEAFLRSAPLFDAQGNPVLDDEGNPRLRYPFRTDIEPVPIGADAVSWFLFDNVDDDGYPIGGYFDYYASSLAVLLRSVGVPARVTTGYVLTEENFDSRTRTYIVRGRHAFTWVEVFFPEYGWVDFDPTPADTSADFLGIAGQRAAAQRFRSFRSDAVDPLFDDVLDLSALDILLGAASIGDLDNVDLGTDRGGGMSIWVMLGPVIGIVALGLAGGGGAVAWRWSLRGLGPAERSWKATHRLARWSGMGPDEAATPSEFAGGLGRAIYEPEAASTLARLYGRVRFGRKDLSEADAEEVHQAWRSVRGKLARRVLRLPLRAPEQELPAPAVPAEADERD